jgi:hypothetical protein
VLRLQVDALLRIGPVIDADVVHLTDDLRCAPASK